MRLLTAFARSNTLSSNRSLCDTREVAGGARLVVSAVCALAFAAGSVGAGGAEWSNYCQLGWQPGAACHVPPPPEDHIGSSAAVRVTKTVGNVTFTPGEQVVLSFQNSSCVEPSTPITIYLGFYNSFTGENQFVSIGAIGAARPSQTKSFDFAVPAVPDGYGWGMGGLLMSFSFPASKKCGFPPPYTGTWTLSTSALPDSSFHTVSGRVEVACPAVAGCTTRPLPLEGVFVELRGPETTAALTDTEGNFKVRVQAGEYTVTPQGAGLQFRPSSRSVDVHSKRAGVDFDACTGSIARTLAGIRSPAGAVWNLYSPNTTDCFNLVGVHYTPARETATVGWIERLARCSASNGKFYGVRLEKPGVYMLAKDTPVSTKDGDLINVTNGLVDIMVNVGADHTLAMEIRIENSGPERRRNASVSLFAPPFPPFKTVLSGFSTCSPVAETLPLSPG